MKFYSIKNANLENEPCGTEGRSLDDLKTVRGVVNRRKACGWVRFTVYSYTNFYDARTFKLVYSTL